ncbi:MAG TPA: hypothetical protein VLV81_12235 [Acidimicrobiia bacterium]|nr:hypothetical protein [Acidimicrobiia bacterium]
MPQIQAHGLAVRTPPGWEGRIFRRRAAGEVTTQTDVPGRPAPPGEQVFPVVHAATIPLAADVADFVSDAVQQLGPTDAIVVLKEYAPANATEQLFAPVGLPRTLDPDAFDPRVLNRQLPGQAGLQRFFNEAGRAFCLYVVLGGFQRRHDVVPAVNGVLATIQITPGGSPAPPSTEPSSTTTSAPAGSTPPTS